MTAMFDKGIQRRMDRAHVKRRVDDLMPLVDRDDDPLGTGDLTTPTHDLPLTEAPHGYDIFRRKVDGCIKVVLHP